MYRKIWMAGLALCLLAGCAPREDSGDGTQSSATAAEMSVEYSETTSLPADLPVESPDALLRTPGEITVYSIRRDSEVFEAHPVPVENPNPTLMDIVEAVEARLDVDIPVLGISQQKGMVVVDIAGGFTDQYDKARVHEILTALAVTLRENHGTFEWIQYQSDGVAGLYGEEYLISPLKLIEDGSGAYDAIRASIPYEGLQYRAAVEAIVETDETGEKLAAFLALVGIADREVASAGDLDNTRALLSALFATKHYSSDAMSADGNYVPALKAFEAPAAELTGIPEDWFWLREHVEQSARLLFGEAFTLIHGDVNKFRYLETIGVYTPPHMGAGADIIPVIFGYEDRGGACIVEVAYIGASMAGYYDPATGDSIVPEKVKDYAENTARRMTVTLNKTDNGGFVFVSQHYIQE